MSGVTLKAMGLGEMIGRRPAGLDGVWRHEEEEEEEIATEKMDANVMPIVMTLHRRPEDQGMINVDVQVKGIGMTYIDCFVDRLLTYCDACLFQAFVRHNKHQQPQQRNPVQVMECNPMHYFLIDGVNCQLDRECFLIIPVCLGSQNSLFIKSNDGSTLKINATDPHPEERFGYRFQVNSKAIIRTPKERRVSLQAETSDIKTSLSDAQTRLIDLISDVNLTATVRHPNIIVNDRRTNALRGGINEPSMMEDNDDDNLFNVSPIASPLLSREEQGGYGSDKNDTNDPLRHDDDEDDQDDLGSFRLELKKKTKTDSTYASDVISARP
jgi:hypothetical protein